MGETERQHGEVLGGNTSNETIGLYAPGRQGTAEARTGRRGGGRLGKTLGIFGVGLGLISLLAPRALGLRERSKRFSLPTGSRSLDLGRGRGRGDVMNLAALNRAVDSARSQPGRLAAAVAALGSVAALNMVVAERSTRRADGGKAVLPAGQAIEVKHSITVNRAPDEVYRFWRDFENLPTFMKHLESVEVTGERRSRWRAKAPVGQTVEWEAEVINDRPNELIAWRSLPGAAVANVGRVRFRPAPGGRGTEVEVLLRYDPPAGKVGQAVAKLLGEEPSQQVPGDLRRFKQVMETGEVVRSEATLEGKRLQRPAQPPKESRARQEEAL
ncbi:MAG: SRPBCC family protein [Chloroflexota bacterium]